MKYSLLILLGVFASFNLYSKTMHVTKDSGLFLDIDGKVWSIDVYTEQPQPMDALKDITIRQVVSSEHSTFFVSQEGQLFAIGRNVNGQLDLGNVYKVTTPQWVTFEDGVTIRQVVSSYGSTFFISQKGQAFATGSNQFARLGLGNVYEVTTPQQVTFENGVAIRQIILNGNSTFFISEEGQVFATGNNINGQLGLGDIRIVTTPQRVTFEGGVAIRQIVSNGASTFFISEAGEVFATGCNGHGQLASGDIRIVTTPQRVTFEGGVAIWQIVSNDNSTFFISQEGQVFVAGCNRHGQLGLGDIDKVFTLQLVTFEDGVAIGQVVLGHNCTFFIGEAGQVFVAGSNEHGQLGLGNVNEVTTPQQVTFEDSVAIRQVISSSDSTFFISEAGQVFATGGNRHGRLGLGHYDSVVTPTRVLMPLNSPITQVEIKYNLDGHGTFFLNENKEVYFAGKTFPSIKKILSPQEVGVDSMVTTPSKLKLPFQVMQPQTKQNKRIKGAHTLSQVN